MSNLLFEHISDTPPCRRLGAEEEAELKDSVTWRSVYQTNDEILRAIMHLHCPDGFECDMTFGNGGFWKRLPRPRLCFDITPLHNGVLKADSRMLPIESASLKSCVFDPPFLTYVRGGREHNRKVAMTSRFGGYYKYSELETHYRDTISEAHRVLKPRGKMIFKCQDIIHNHRMHCTHVHVIKMAETKGFRLVDLFVLTAKHRMPGPQKGKQRHARIWHSYFLVLERNALMNSLTNEQSDQIAEEQRNEVTP